LIVFFKKRRVTYQPAKSKKQPVASAAVSLDTSRFYNEPSFLTAVTRGPPEPTCETEAESASFNEIEKDAIQPNRQF